MIQVIICDDHPLITQGLKSYFASHNEIAIAATASSAQELREALATATQANVILLDIQLPDGNGIDLCGEIKRQYPHIKILGLSNLDGKNLIIDILEKGASGYMLKSAPMEEIVKAILHIHEGRIYLGKNAQQSFSSAKFNLSEEIPLITRREREVLEYLDQGLSSVQIAEKMFISPLTIETHRRNLLQKFKVNKTVNLLKKVKEIGVL